ncbi:hypothetical protein PG988_000310 [Apiospora saccharicola]
MAKRKPVFTLQDMEKRLGYSLPLQPTQAECRFYSDLRRVPKSQYERTEKEFQMSMDKNAERPQSVGSQALLSCGRIERIKSSADLIVISQQDHNGLYRFNVDVVYHFGLTLSLLLSEVEAAGVMSIAKLSSRQFGHLSSRFFTLPAEIRLKIYEFAIPSGIWHIDDANNFVGNSWPRSIGDCNGFYFPISKQLSLLRANQKLRQEALPVAFQHTTFHLDDLDDLMKLLVAIGRTGRENIESLQFPWESRTDLECRWDEHPADEDNDLNLPVLHVSACVRLLQECRRLRSIQVRFHSELLAKVSPVAFKADNGIKGLCSLQGLQQVEVLGSGGETLEEYPLANWLEAALRMSGSGYLHQDDSVQYV